MPKRVQKPRKTAKKRGPKEERLIITGDPEAAFKRLLTRRKAKTG